MEDQRLEDDKWYQAHKNDPEYLKMLELCHNYHQIHQDYHSDQQIQNNIVSCIAKQNALILMLLGVLANDRLQKGEINMKFQIINQNGDVVDKNLSYEEALMWVDSSTGMNYIMVPMKED